LASSGWDAWDEEPVKSSPQDTSDTETKEASLHQMIRELLESGGQRKQDIADDLVGKIVCSGDTAPTWATWTAFSILRSTKPGRVDDCLGIFSRLSPTVIRDAIQDAWMRYRPDPENVDWVEDYWYVLIRSLGGIVKDWPSEQFTAIIDLASQVPLLGLREAAVLALGDIGDDDAVDGLRRIAAADRSPMIRQLAEEMLEEIAE